MLGGSDWAKELYVHGSSKSGYRRLDGYNEADRQILSLKSGQYGGPDPRSTYRLKKALDELVDKYRQGAVIANVPSTPPALAGRVLTGDMLLGIPVQMEPLPKEVVDHARELDVTLVEIHVRR